MTNRYSINFLFWGQCSSPKLSTTPNKTSHICEIRRIANIATKQNPESFAQNILDPSFLNIPSTVFKFSKCQLEYFLASQIDNNHENLIMGTFDTKIYPLLRRFQPQSNPPSRHCWQHLQFLSGHYGWRGPKLLARLSRFVHHHFQLIPFLHIPYRYMFTIFQ